MAENKDCLGQFSGVADILLLVFATQPGVSMRRPLHLQHSTETYHECQTRQLTFKP